MNKLFMEKQTTDEYNELTNMRIKSARKRVLVCGFCITDDMNEPYSIARQNGVYIAHVTGPSFGQERGKIRKLIELYERNVPVEDNFLIVDDNLVQRMVSPDGFFGRDVTFETFEDISVAQQYINAFERERNREQSTDSRFGKSPFHAAIASVSPHLTREKLDYYLQLADQNVDFPATVHYFSPVSAAGLNRRFKELIDSAF